MGGDGPHHTELVGNVLPFPAATTFFLIVIK